MSYAHADARIALHLHDVLTSAGHDVWLDMANLPPGVDWWDGVRRAIDLSADVLFLVSGESSRSTSCLRELAYASTRDKRIVRINANSFTSVAQVYS